MKATTTTALAKITESKPKYPRDRNAPKAAEGSRESTEEEDEEERIYKYIEKNRRMTKTATNRRVAKRNENGRRTLSPST